MGTTLQQILGSRNLIGLIQTVKPGLPSNLFPPGLMNVTKRVEGNYGTYRRSAGTQQTARFTHYGAAGKKRAASAVGEVPVKLLHVKEEMDVNPATLVNLESQEGNRQRLGEDEVGRMVAEAKVLLENNRYATFLSMFGRGGLVDVDVDGNLLPDTSTSVYQLDWSIPANNLNQINGIIGTSWATNSTDILGDLRAISDQAIQTSGMPLAHAIYGANIPEYLATNDVLGPIFARQAEAQSATLGGTIPNGVGGLKWWPGHGHFYRDSSDTVRSLIGADTIVLIPEISTAWLDFIEGSAPVPKDLNVAADMSAALKNTVLAPGMFMYAFQDPHSMTITMVYGDTHLPMITAPGAVLVADVTP